MKKLLIAFGLIGFLAACTSEEKTVRALEAAGYSNIVSGGYDFFGCSEDDFYATRFSAVGPTGVPVTGVVCAGFFKGSTIRLD